MNTKLFKILLVGAVSACGFSMRVMATPTVLLPNTTVSLAAVTSYPGSTNVVNETDAFFGGSTPGAIQGTVKAYVLTGFDDNPWAASGGLTFVYQIFNSELSTDSITGMGISGWAGFSTDVADNAYPNGAVPPSFAERSLNGKTVTFGWQPPGTEGKAGGFGEIAPGEISYQFVIYTDATSYVDVTAGVRDGAGASLITLGPAVPDGGTTALLLGLGLLGMGLIRRARKS